MDYEETESRRIFNLERQEKKLGDADACTSTLYNKYPTLDKIDTTFAYQNPDGSYNHKIVDHS